MQLTTYKDYAQMSAFAAATIIELVKNKPDAVLCLASGDTPRFACELTADRGRKENVDFSQCTFIGLDEWFGIPPENKGSCRHFFETLLLDPLNFSAPKIHLFDALSTDPQRECARMDKAIKDAGGIDLMIVGVGMNGHIGFNEPGVSFDNYCHIIDLDPLTISVGQKYFTGPVTLKQGITVGLRHLTESKQVLMMANGLKKAPIIRKTLESEISNAFPATIMRSHPNGLIITDDEAASLVEN